MAIKNPKKMIHPNQEENPINILVHGFGSIIPQTIQNAPITINKIPKMIPTVLI